MQSSKDRQSRMPSRSLLRSWRHCAPAVFAACASCLGCASFWDDVTSRDFKMKHLVVKPDPLAELRDSSDGDRRARALRRLKEPKQHGGTQQEQDLYVDILTKAAWSERESLCRLAAIHSLRDYKDPRVVEGLKEAYYRAGSFNSETATIVRCAALEALGHVGQPGAVELLVKVLREPPTEGAELDRQMKADERVAAARALGRYKQYQATSALVQVLESDKDVALRNRANESLQLCTGKRFPADAKLWGEYFRDPAAAEKAYEGTRTWKDKSLEILPAGWFK